MMAQVMATQETIADLVQKILKLPAEERLRVMTEKLRDFALMDPRHRAATMRGVVDEIGRLTPEERKAFLRTRNLAFLDLPIGTRMALTGTRAEVLEGLSEERLREEAEVLESLAPNADPQRETILKQMLTATRARTGAHDRGMAAPRGSSTKKRWWEIWRR